MSEYGDAFFAAMGKENYSASQIIRALYDYVRPRSVLDVGCGTGSWLHAFSQAGVADIRGLDGDYVNRDLLAIDPQYFTPVELTSGFDLKRRYDLTVCMEVAEHLPFACAERLIADLCRHANVVLFSAALPLQGGTHHVNERWLEYWAILFSGQGFAAYDIIRPRVAAEKDVQFYFRQNTIVFANAEGRMSFGKPAVAVKDRLLSTIDPELFFLVATKSFPALSRAAIELEMQDYLALAKAWLAGEREAPALAIRDMKTVDLSWDRDENGSHRRFR